MCLLYTLLGLGGMLFGRTKVSEGRLKIKLFQF